jgi:hypothetical protein
MKKFFTGVLTTMLLVGMMGTVVFAATSPNSETALKQQAEEWNKNVTSVTGSGSTSEAVSVEAKALDTSAMSQANAKVTSEYQDASVLAMTDLSVPEDTDLTDGVTVTMNVTGVLPGDNIKVLHQTSSGEWETLTPIAVGNGTVTVTLHSFSPIVILRVSGIAGTVGSGNGNGADDSSDGTNDSQNGNQTSDGTYNDGYQDGYAAGAASSNQISNTNTSNSSTGNNNSQANNSGNKATATAIINNYGGTSAGGSSSGVTTVGNSSATSPKTGASLPALPILAVLLSTGIVVCGRKAYNN